MQITLVGAGIGGLGVALALARSGHSVRVLERAPNLAEVGAGIQVSANGCRVLQRWGLLDNLLEKADAAAYGFFGNGLTGRALCKYPLSAYSESHYQLPHLQVHRADLLDTILHACNQTEGVEIFTDAQ